MKNCIVNSFAYLWQLAEVLTMIFLAGILFCTYFIKSFSWLSKNIMVSLFCHARCIWYFKHKNNWTIMNPNRKKHLAFHILLLKICILGAGYAKFKTSHLYLCANIYNWSVLQNSENTNNWWEHKFSNFKSLLVRFNSLKTKLKFWCVLTRALTAYLWSSKNWMQNAGR